MVWWNVLHTSWPHMLGWRIAFQCFLICPLSNICWNTVSFLLCQREVFHAPIYSKQTFHDHDLDSCSMLINWPSISLSPCGCSYFDNFLRIFIFGAGRVGLNLIHVWSLLSWAWLTLALIKMKTGLRSLHKRTHLCFLSICFST